MIELGSPAWLAGLALVPLIRALHRLRGAGQVQVVPAAFLWRDLPNRGETGTRLAQPDPAWRRRALATALLVLTLSAPDWWSGDGTPIEVLVDNRPSLLTREADGEQRVNQAALAISEASQREPGHLIQLLAADGRAPPENLDARDLPGLVRALERLSEASPAPQSLAAPSAAGARRWLVSDGSGGAETLSRMGPFERVIPVGHGTENLGITGLAARQALDAPGHLDTLVTVTNLGHQDGVSTLTLTAADRTLGQAELRVAAGATVSQAWQVPAAGPTALEARLEPADALESDDRIALDLGLLMPLAVQVAGGCGAAAQTLIVAHPALRLQDQGPAALRVWCGTEAPESSDPPTLWLPPGRPVATAAGVLRWSVTGPHPQLEEAETLIPLVLAATPAGDTLFTLGGQPLVIEQPGAHRLIGLFDTGPATASSSAMPLLLDWLLGRLAGRELLFPIAGAARAPEVVRVAPGPLSAADPSGGHRRHDGSDVPLWPLPLVAAVALLWLDLRRLRIPSAA